MAGYREDAKLIAIMIVANALAEYFPADREIIRFLRKIDKKGRILVTRS